MNCPTHTPLLSRFLDGELIDSERARIELHLRGCEGCRSTLEEWRMQGARWKSLVARHTLKDEFVHRVRLARVSSPIETHSAERGWLGGDLFAWLQAAAAVFVVGLLLAHLSPSPMELAFAQVVSAGERLEVQSSGSGGWMPTSLGATLRRGDWVRSLESGSAELLLHKSSRITLERNALAQLRQAEDGQSEVLLVGGSMISNAEPGARGIHVRTAAGEIRAIEAHFGARVREFAVADLEFKADGSEILSGAVERIAGISVDRGKVEVKTPTIRRELLAGSHAQFTSSLFGVLSSGPLDDSRIGVSLQRLNPTDGGRGVLSARLAEASDGIRVAFQADRVSLKRLIEWTTGATVRGNDEIHVTGQVDFPFEADPRDLASAIGPRLGLDLSIRPEKVRGRFALLPQTDLPRDPVSASPEFAVERSPNEMISLSFRDVSAELVFRILRSSGVELPELSAESRRTALTLRAESMRPADVSSWLKRELRWSLEEREQVRQVVELRLASDTASGVTDPGVSGAAENQVRSTSTVAQAPPGSGVRTHESLSENWAARSGVVARATFLSSPPIFIPNQWLGMNHSLTAGLTTRATRFGGRTVTLVTAETGETGLTITMRLSKESREETVIETAIPARGSRHLVWPALASQAGAIYETYTVYNPAQDSVRAAWRGYDSSGRLLASYEQEIAGRSTAVLNPGVDLAAVLERGGHWETISDSELWGTGTTSDPGHERTYAADRVEDLRESREYPVSYSGQQGEEAAVWLVNPGEVSARLVIVLLSEDRPVAAAEVFLAPHAGMIWSADEWLASYTGNRRPGLEASVLLQVMNGTVASGRVRDSWTWNFIPPGDGWDRVTIEVVR